MNLTPKEAQTSEDITNNEPRMKSIDKHLRTNLVCVYPDQKKPIKARNNDIQFEHFISYTYYTTFKKWKRNQGTCTLVISDFMVCICCWVA